MIGIIELIIIELINYVVTMLVLMLTEPYTSDNNISIVLLSLFLSLSRSLYLTLYI